MLKEQMLLREVADLDPLIPIDDARVVGVECFFCDQARGLLHEGDEFQHRPDCLHQRIKAACT